MQLHYLLLSLLPLTIAARTPGADTSSRPPAERLTPSARHTRLFTRHADPTTCDIVATVPCRACPCADCPVVEYLEEGAQAELSCWVEGSTSFGTDYWDKAVGLGCWVPEGAVVEGCWVGFDACQ